MKVERAYIPAGTDVVLEGEGIDDLEKATVEEAGFDFIVNRGLGDSVYMTVKSDVYMDIVLDVKGDVVIFVVFDGVVGRINVGLLKRKTVEI